MVLHSRRENYLVKRQRDLKVVEVTLNFKRVKKALTKKIKFNRRGRQKEDRRRKAWEEHITRRPWSINMKTGLCACLNKFWVPSTCPRWPLQISLYTSDHSFIHYRLNDFIFAFMRKMETDIITSHVSVIYACIFLRKLHLVLLQ